MGRFTRLTNAFSKEARPRCGHRALLHVLRLGRIHQTLRVTPAMEPGVANHVWSVEEIVALLA